MARRELSLTVRPSEERGAGDRQRAEAVDHPGVQVVGDADARLPIAANTIVCTSTAGTTKSL